LAARSLPKMAGSTWGKAGSACVDAGSPRSDPGLEHRGDEPAPPNLDGCGNWCPLVGTTGHHPLWSLPRLDRWLEPIEVN
jgi:hypothetical protein